MYTPNMFGLRNDNCAGAGGSQERLLIARDEEEMAGDGPCVDDHLEMECLEQRGCEVVDVLHWHGTNTLNTSWGWMV